MTLRTGIATGTALIALAGTLAGCGGSGAKPSANSSGRSLASANLTAAKTQIERTWSAFFSGSTPAAEKARLLENGVRFAPVIRAQVNSPLAHQTKATVTSVTLQGPSRAKVVYTITVAGQPALKHQIGTAVRIDGTWRVSDRSFCGLLSLQGSAPPLCPHA
ncbi:MAG: hypothetical protein ACXVE1_16555 [Gaiellaceae bacterium]